MNVFQEFVGSFVCVHWLCYALGLKVDIPDIAFVKCFSFGVRLCVGEECEHKPLD